MKPLSPKGEPAPQPPKGGIVISIDKYKKNKFSNFSPPF